MEPISEAIKALPSERAVDAFMDAAHAMDETQRASFIRALMDRIARERMADPQGIVRPPAGQGIKYVTGLPKPAPIIVRPLKQEIWDWLIVPEYGKCSVDLYEDYKWFPDHTPKVKYVHTNMGHDGQLGFPLEYDLSAFDMTVEKCAHPEDLARVRRSLEFSWFFGQYPWLKARGSSFKPLLVVAGELDGQKEAVERRLNEFADRGFWPSYRLDFTQRDLRVTPETPDHEALGVSKEEFEKIPKEDRSKAVAAVRAKHSVPRRISSTEAFHAHVEVDAGELHGPLHLRFSMQDTLFAQP